MSGSTSSQTRHLAPAGYAGVDADRVGAFFAGRGTRNGCGQAAVACLLRFWGLDECGLGTADGRRRTARAPSAGRRLPSAVPHPQSAIVDQVYRRFPPDTPGRLFGTTPGRVEAACRGFGLSTARWWGSELQARERLLEALAARQPVIVLLDLQRLGGGWGFHYAVAFGCEAAAVHCTNMLPTRHSREPVQAIPWSEFMRAWWCWLPGRRFKWMGIRAWRDE
jgi:hypothetical protein